MNDIALNYEEKDVIDYAGLPVKCLLYCCERGEQPFPLHWHRRMELLHIYSGSLQLTMGGQTLVAEAGDTVCIHPRCPHVAIAGPHGVRYRVIMFETGLLSEELLPYLAPLRELSAGTMRFHPVVRDERVTAEIHALTDAYYVDEPAPILVLGQLYRLVGLLARDFCDREYTSHPADRRLWEVIDYIENNYTSPLTTAQISAHFHYEEAYLCRRFRQQTGLTVLAYCHTLRLNRARRLLEQTDQSIARIGSQCGYDTTSYFIRKFNEQFGMTPAKWRRAHGEKGKARAALAFAVTEEIADE